MHFIEFVCVKTNDVVRSNSNMIFTRQTCGQRSSRVAGSKRRALAFYVSVRIRCMFLISICRGESDVCLCMTSVLAKTMRPRSADFGFENVFGGRIRWKLALRSRILFASTESFTDLDSTFLYISISRTYTIFVLTNKMLALGVCLPQPCSSAGRKFAASRSRVDYYRPICSFPHERI